MHALSVPRQIQLFECQNPSSFDSRSRQARFRIHLHQITWFKSHFMKYETPLWKPFSVRLLQVSTWVKFISIKVSSVYFLRVGTIKEQTAAGDALIEMDFTCSYILQRTNVTLFILGVISRLNRFLESSQLKFVSASTKADFVITMIILAYLAKNGNGNDDICNL